MGDRWLLNGRQVGVEWVSDGVEWVLSESCISAGLGRCMSIVCSRNGVK